jgi:hypothetical protein
MTMQIANNPLFIEDLSLDANQITRGSTAKRPIIVKNLGEKKADIDIWIAATDAKSEPLLQWCTFSEQNPLRLEAKEDRKVILSFEIPAQATPDLYNYEILIEAPVQYPDKPPFRRTQQLRVLRSDQDAEWGNEPGFTLHPLTNSANPYLLKAGEKLEVKVTVENRSKRVDRFYLTCPELSTDWYTIRYPKSGLETAGLVQETDGLQLNPGKTGEITLILHPPQYTPAGNYFPTVRLISRNKEEDLVLLDVVYLQLLPDETLTVELHPLLLKIPTQQGKFEVQLINQGNITREIAISASDREELFTYTSELLPVPIPPGYSSTIPLNAKPRKWWRRPLWGKALEFNFVLELENNKLLFLPENTKPPQLPKELPQGTIIWEPRPWWQIWLPILLLLLLALGLISVGAFFYWQKVLIQPKLNKVDPTEKVYQELDGETVILNLSIRDWRNWEFKNWRFQNNPKLSTLKIIPQSREGTGKIISYDYNQLVKLCQLQNQNLNCTNIPTEIKKAGEYTFKIEVYSQGQNKPTDSKETDTIIIEPIDTPKIIEFSSNKPIYREVLKEQVFLNWKISNPNQIQNLILTQQGSNGSPVKKTFIQCNPQELKPQVRGKIEKINNIDVLVCQGIATNVTQAGDYTFKLEVFSKQNPTQPSDTKQTDTIAIQPLPIPKIIDKILPNKLTYEYKEPIFLSWRLSNPSQIQELRIVEQGSDAPVTKNTIPLSQCKPQQLKPAVSQPINPFKIEPAPEILICENIPMTPTKAGSYTYKLEVISRQNPNQPSDTKETDTIAVKPLPVPKTDKIVPNKLAYEYKEPILLSWSIANPNQVKELRILQQGSDGVVTKKTIPLSQCNPQQLTPGNNPATITCQNIPMTPTKAGSYTYKLEVISRQNPNQPSDVKETDTIVVKPLPVPKLDRIVPNKLAYEYKEPILLSWSIANPNQLKELRILQQGSDGVVTKKTIPLSQCKPQQLTPGNNPATITCQNIPMTPTKPGSYIYKLEVISQENPNQPTDSKETDTIVVKPLPVPKIGQISSNKPFYEAAKNEEILLNWEISDANQIKELRLISLAPDGSVNSQLKRYPIINNTLPAQLKNFCTLTNSLICKNLPTGAKQAGDYTFKLTVIPKQGEAEPEIAKNTPNIKIKPIPPKPATPVKIVYFKINGQDASEKPKHVYEINKERKPVDIILSWQVEPGEDIKVELLPFGDVQKPQGSKTYTLSKPPSSVTITLRVTNKAGEQTTQSVTLETVEPTRIIPPQTPSPGGIVPGETVPGETAPGTASPSPGTADRLSPIELPPKPD